MVGAYGMRRVATEEHFTVPEVLEALRTLSRSTWKNPDLSLYGSRQDERHPIIDGLTDFDERLARMDKSRIAMQVLSAAAPGVQLFDSQTASNLAGIANEQLAEIIEAKPDRFAGLALFAPQDPSGAAKEMARAIDELGLNGFVVHSHTDGHYLDEERFWPIFEAAEALARPIYLHPRSLPKAFNVPFRQYHLLKAAWGYAVETGTHALRIILSGALDRFPDLTIVLGHMGEGLPYWGYRVDKWTDPSSATWKNKGSEETKLELKPSEYLKRNFFITTSGMHDGPPLELCRTVLGAERIMFATDHPFESMEDSVDFYDNLDWPTDQLEDLFHKNAERVFGIADPSDK